MAQKLVFDSSTIISISEKCLTRLLKGLGQEGAVSFVIPQSVYAETVERPLHIKRFELGALRIQQAVDEGWIEIIPGNAAVKQLTGKILDSANTLFFAKGKPLTIIQKGEAETLALCKNLRAHMVAIDERTTRMLIEDPWRLQNYVAYKHQQDIKLNEGRLKEFIKLLSDIRVVRSVELIALAYERGYFEEVLPRNRQALEAALFALKFGGCAVSSQEIEEFLRAKR
ncbi:MAG TPA: hypothetical protein HA252_00670 [Candidatus Diapherotrites archaeon]|uniref:PIN domain-containing protein n=1 Tax=Candidatus Iainarchaeum sp. TaxID=3101447 RepID=A0A7J4JDR7_9ARCH|nr:hypothetical protein [Candidatus Diapherotrites archaeon]HIH15902.1 hypothetical protein [Candidatus Diapherotrites archaeon]